MSHNFRMREIHKSMRNPMFPGDCLKGPRGGGGGHKLFLRAWDRHGKLQRTLNWKRNEKMQMNRHRVGQEGEEETKIRGLRSQRFKKEERVDRRVDRRERATPLGPGEVPLLHIRPHQ